MGVADAWIAATALEFRLELVTHNPADFQGIPGLIVITEAPKPFDAVISGFFVNVMKLASHLQALPSICLVEFSSHFHKKAHRQMRKRTWLPDD
jgi:hypothetical protein